jgi:hypothetical protein
MNVSTYIPKTKLLQACNTLFGERPGGSLTFLHALQPAEVRTAYRKRAKETHPDLFFQFGADTQQRQSSLFQEVM